MTSFHKDTHLSPWNRWAEKWHLSKNKREVLSKCFYMYIQLENIVTVRLDLNLGSSIKPCVHKPALCEEGAISLFPCIHHDTPSGWHHSVRSPPPPKAVGFHGLGKPIKLMIFNYINYTIVFKAIMSKNTIALIQKTSFRWILTRYIS